MTSKQHNNLSNQLVSRLTASSRTNLAAKFKDVEMPLGQRLSLSGQALEHAYFPTSGMISLIHNHKDGSTIEVGLVGNEGFWGTHAILGVRSSPIEAMVQGAGRALRIKASDLRQLANNDDGLNRVLLQYAHVVHVQAAVTAGCNAQHKVLQRLARWILDAQDRLHDEEIVLSHEFLSFMLGIRRAGVTAGLKTLKSRGAILPRRGRIKIVNRKLLESMSCECYAVIKNEYRGTTGAARHSHR